MVKNSLRVVLLLLYFLCCGHDLLAADLPKRKQEMRAVWLTTIYGLDWPKKPASSARDEEQQRRELVTILDRLEKVGINTVFLQVRGRGTLIYPSELESMSPDFLSSRARGTLGYDPLAFAIKECNKRGIALHVWYVVIPLGNDRYVRRLPASAYVHKYKQSCLHFQGEWYMDPARVETAFHMRRLVKELLDHYEVAGIHLDYIRYPDNAKKFPDANMYQSMGRGVPLADWRRGNIEKIVAEVKDEIDAHPRKVLLSTAVLGAYRELPKAKRRIGWTAYSDVYQDPAVWGKKGLVDFIVPMLYYKDDRFAPYVRDWLDVMGGTPIVMGLGAYRVLNNEGNWAPRTVLEQIDQIGSNRKIAGAILFRTEQLLDQRHGLYRGISQRWGYEKRLPYLYKSNEGYSDHVVQDLMLQKQVDGLKVSWKGVGEYYTVYLTKECDEPNLNNDLYTVTRGSEVLIPWSDIDKETTIYIKVGSYMSNSSLEDLEPVGALYYNTENEK